MYPVLLLSKRLMLCYVMYINKPKHSVKMQTFQYCILIAFYRNNHCVLTQKSTFIRKVIAFNSKKCCVYLQKLLCLFSKTIALKRNKSITFKRNIFAIKRKRQRLNAKILRLNAIFVAFKHNSHCDLTQKIFFSSNKLASLSFNNKVIKKDNFIFDYDN